METQSFADLDHSYFAGKDAIDVIDEYYMVAAYYTIADYKVAADYYRTVAG